jgi:hypothetical protein
MHMSDEDFGEPGESQAPAAGRLRGKLPEGAFRTVDDLDKKGGRRVTFFEDGRCKETVKWGRVLHKEPSPTTSATRLEQFLWSVGPPPLFVPRKVTDMVCCCMCVVACPVNSLQRRLNLEPILLRHRACGRTRNIHLPVR